MELPRQNPLAGVPDLKNLRVGIGALLMGGERQRLRRIGKSRGGNVVHGEVFSLSRLAKTCIGWRDSDSHASRLIANIAQGIPDKEMRNAFRGRGEVRHSVAARGDCRLLIGSSTVHRALH